jgi:ABC-type bacteriocin/lantibiotic exporter with double-glycine peptidase domain
MEWLREENRKLTRMTFLSAVLFLASIVATIVSRVLTDGYIPDLLMATSVVLALVLGSAIATERAIVTQSVRIKKLEDRLAALEENVAQAEENV